MWSKNTAKLLIKEGNKSEDKLTRDLARYLDYALYTVEYYEKETKEENVQEKN